MAGVLVGSAVLAVACYAGESDHSGTFDGPSQHLGNGEVSTYVTVDQSAGSCGVALTGLTHRDAS
ncbi:hypothetical protein [Nocardia panacis]|uniref:hypothetical protein n=1 Tax=Nocardia panacis TaxID=2340916 RepID=UPI00131562C1|nr:hypothetical protein [Nocardia panacis]